MMYADRTVFEPESVMHVNLSGTAQNFTSAGGFSNYYKQPDYQKAAVETYFDRAGLTYPYYEGIGLNLSEMTGLYNRIGRGFPDVSANGAQFRAYTGGEDFHWYGSSLASPIFASVLTLVCTIFSFQSSHSLIFVYIFSSLDQMGGIKLM